MPLPRHLTLRHQRLGRRSTAGLLIAALAATALGCSRTGDDGDDRGNLDVMIDSLVASLSPDGPYRDPRKAERQAARQAVGQLIDGGTEPPAKLLSGVGFRAVHGVQATDGRKFTFYRADEDTGWGGLLVEPSVPIRSVVEVPHPAYDLNTEKLGLDLFRRLPGSAMLIAGAHRQAEGDDADVAHNDRSMFHVFSEEFAERGVPQLQLHGFADRSLPGADAVVSTGAGPENELAVRIARELKAEDVRVCRAWVSHCVGLEGTTNVQGTTAAEHGAEFVHLELGWGLRRDESGRQLVRDAVVAAWNG
ncbi:hypothetical protein AB0368_12730 [Actinoplanes sp. NPDC051475]|uniref:hypothetical protein n=1 Tax=Actinoplanes sp. NPDC051475 TaxID=3157225 RepID=UPI00344E0416